MRRPTVAAITLAPHGGGVAAVSRLVWKAVERRWPETGSLQELVPHDATSIDSSTLDRMAFGARIAQAQVVGTCDSVFYTHLAVARVQQYVPRPVRRPYAVFLHGIEVWDDLPPSHLEILSRASVRVSNSHYTATRVERAHPEVGAVISCPLGLEFGRLPHAASVARPDSRTVIVVGRMSSAERYKGHDALIDAWPYVLIQVPDARLVCVGEGDDVDRLRARAAMLPNHSVSFPGFLTTDALARAYSEASVFAMPSRGEGFGLVYLEAMSHGLPCIGSRHDAAGDVILDGETGYLVDQSDAAEVAARLTSLLLQPATREAMGARAQAHVADHFTFDHFAERLYSILDRTWGAGDMVSTPSSAA
jgi:phosphatidylinositol alpha-1,6-mannosyltransferase